MKIFKQCQNCDDDEAELFEFAGSTTYPKLDICKIG